MNRLIAMRPVIYRSRTYQRGDFLPSADPLLEEAWVKSGSAIRDDTVHVARPVPVDAGSNDLLKAEQLALDCIAGLGLKIVDKSGEFVGNENFTEQIRILGQSLMQDYADLFPPVPGMPADGELPEERILDVGPDGHFTRASLSRMRTAELTALAEDFGIDLSGCRTNAERVEALATVDTDALLEPPEDSPSETDGPENAE